jgi:hypothetical protein
MVGKRLGFQDVMTKRLMGKRQPRRAQRRHRQRYRSAGFVNKAMAPNESAGLRLHHIRRN